MINYTVWSRGRELGYSRLEYVRCMEKLRVGAFFPTDAGLALMPALTGVREAWLKVAVASKRGEHEGMSGAEIYKTTVFADVFAAAAHAQALQLELRGPDGKVIPTEDIDVRDTELFIPEIHGVQPDDISVDDLDDEARACVEEMIAHLESLPEPKEWEPAPEFPRYQLSVELLNEWAIP